MEHFGNNEQIDVICGMEAHSSEIKATYLSKEYRFCSNHCRGVFLKEPGKYLSTHPLEKSTSSPKSQSVIKTYFPLFLILVYLAGGTILFEWNSPTFNSMRMMRHFMGGFFLFFSFFKFLDLGGFAEAYKGYDVIASKFPVYGWIYPFVELTLGIFYVSGFSLWTTDLITLIVMLISCVGVARSLFRNSRIQCACLGTIFKLPMTSITLFEDLLMATMAFIGLVEQGRAIHVY